MLLLDTSVWLALFDGEPLEPDLASLGSATLVTSPIVLAELASLQVRRGMPTTLVDDVLATARVEDLTAEDAVAAGALHGRLRSSPSSKAGLGDCLLHATARRLGATLVTLDGDLAREPGVIVLRRSKPRRGRA